MGLLEFQSVQDRHIDPFLNLLCQLLVVFIDRLFVHALNIPSVLRWGDGSLEGDVGGGLDEGGIGEDGGGSVDDLNQRL